MEITQELMDMLIKAAEEGLRIGTAGTAGDYTAQGIAASVVHGQTDLPEYRGCEFGYTGCTGLGFNRIDPYQAAIYQETVTVRACTNCIDRRAESI